jgi:NADPH-dependent ferric siderophore reductase
VTTATAAPARRKGGPGHRLTVLRTEQLSPRIVRVVLGGPGLAGVADTAFTDRYVKLVFPRPGVAYPEPFDMAEIRSAFPREQWPVIRTYTVRALDHDAGEMTVDLVTHGDSGVAGPWALTAAPGDEIVVLGPGGAYAPADDAEHHLLVGDESALPAIAAAAERVRPGVAVRVVLLVDGPADELALTSPGDLEVTWVHRGTGGSLLDTVRALTWPATDPDGVQAFVHGEAGEVRELRRHLLAERGVLRERLSVSGYWRRGFDDETFRELKAAEREAEQAAAAT